MDAYQVRPLPGIGEVTAGDHLVKVLIDALAASRIALQAGDVLVVAQKIVSKAEGRSIDLCTVDPSSRALELAAVTGKDPRLIQLVLSETQDILRAGRDVLIVRHRLGYVMANAGIDRSNVPGAAGEERVLLLPLDPDASARQLRDGLEAHFGARIAVIICDSFGRPWRRGVVNIALGCAGLEPLVDRRGEADREGRLLAVSQVAAADALASAAGLCMGEADEGLPAVLIRGYTGPLGDTGARKLVRPVEEDLFR